MISYSAIGPWQILLLLLVTSTVILPIVALIDIVRNSFSGSNKIIWILVVVLIPFFGPLLYYITGVKYKISKF